MCEGPFGQRTTDDSSRTAWTTNHRRQYQKIPKEQLIQRITYDSSRITAWATNQMTVTKGQLGQRITDDSSRRQLRQRTTDDIFRRRAWTTNHRRQFHKDSLDTELHMNVPEEQSGQ